MAFEAHPLLVYLDDSTAVDDFLALGQQVDGFLLRGVKNVYDFSVRPGTPTLNTDAWRQRSDAVRVDATYFSRYDLIHQHFPGKPIYMVIEGNPALDRDLYEPHDPALLGQFAMVREVVQTTRYLPDAFLIKITDYQWWQGGRLQTCTETNFDTCYNFFLQTLYNKYKKETEIWTSATLIKLARPAFIAAIDRWNNPTFGGPRYPVGYSFYHASVPNGRTLTTPRVMLSELQDPIEPLEVSGDHPWARWNGQPLKEVHLSLGSFSSFQKPASQHFGLWGFDQNNYFPGVKNALTGTTKALEVFTHGLATADFYEYIGFLPKGAPDTTPPGKPINVTVEMDGELAGVIVSWQQSGNEAYAEVDIHRDGTYYDTIAGGSSYFDNDIAPGEVYGYQLEAVDAAGNRSGLTDVVTIITPRPNDLPPTAPTNLICSLFSEGGAKVAADLHWTASQDDHGVIGYRVYRADSGGALEFLWEIDRPSSYDATVEPGHGYTYAVTAFDGAGQESERSNLVTLEVPGQEPENPVLEHEIARLRLAVEDLYRVMLIEMPEVRNAMIRVADVLAANLPAIAAAIRENTNPIGYPILPRSSEKTTLLPDDGQDG